MGSGDRQVCDDGGQCNLSGGGEYSESKGGPLGRAFFKRKSHWGFEVGWRGNHNVMASNPAE